jgi:hypothetical protein
MKARMLRIERKTLAILVLLTAFALVPLSTTSIYAQEKVALGTSGADVSDNGGESITGAGAGAAGAGALEPRAGGSLDSGTIVAAMSGVVFLAILLAL